MCATWFCCYGGKIKVESWDYVSISVVLVCQSHRPALLPKRREITWQTFVTVAVRVLFSRWAPARCLNDTRRIFTLLYFWKQGEIPRQYSQTPSLCRSGGNINVEEESHTKEIRLQMKHLGLFALAILCFSIKNIYSAFGFFSSWYPARWCIFIHNTSVKHYIT